MTEPLAWIDAATDAGWLRPVDRALARFLAAREGSADPRVALAAALTSHQAGRGHTCVDLAVLGADPDSQLALPPQGDASGLATPGELLGERPPSAWRERLLASKAVGTGDSARPLVLDGSRLYLRRYWACEQAVADGLARRLVADRPSPAAVQEALVRYFDAAPETADWQRIAVALAVGARLAVISGGPGTGKTTTVARLLAVIQERALDEAGTPLRVQLAAPTGKAAARLGESLQGALDALPCPPRVRASLEPDVATLHRLLGARMDTRRFRHHRGNPLHTDLVVVDEASMVDVELMAALLDALPARARLILLGDKDQLASVEAGAVLGDLCAGAETPGYGEATRHWLAAAADTPALPGDRRGGLAEHITLLRHSYRFDAASGIGALASAVNAGDGAAARTVLAQAYPDIRWRTITGGDDPALHRVLTEGYVAYLDCLGEPAPAPDTALTAFNRFRVLCATRHGPWGVQHINEQLVRTLHRRGLTATTEGWYPGRPVMITRNDRRLGLYNGDVGVTLTDPVSGRLRVYFEDGPGEPPRAVLPSRLTAVETVFAMTVHKSQGSEFTHAALILPERPGPPLTRELLYTGITRAREGLTLMGADPAVIGPAAERRIHRASGLREALQNRLGNLTHGADVQ